MTVTESCKLVWLRKAAVKSGYCATPEEARARIKLANYLSLPEHLHETAHKMANAYNAERMRKVYRAKKAAAANASSGEEAV